jgi:hypothetical protein
MVCRFCVSVLAMFGCAAEGGETTPGRAVPFFGGTVLASEDSRRAIVSDPDRDRVLAIDLATSRVVAQRAFSAGDEPGALVEDGAGRIHVVLRSGAVATLAKDLSLLQRRSVCVEPRGIAWQPSIDSVHVACASGELVTMSSSGSTVDRVVELDRDLRDVVIDGDLLLVTRMKSAEVLTVDADGLVVNRQRPPTVERRRGDGTTMLAQPAVAWRTVALPGGGVVMAHQRALRSPLSTAEGGYARGACAASPVEVTATIFYAGQPSTTLPPLTAASVGMDVAVAGDGRLAFVTAGDLTVRVYGDTFLAEVDRDPCDTTAAPVTELARIVESSPSPVTATTFAPDGTLLTFNPASSRLGIYQSPGADSPTFVDLGGASTQDVGRSIFHRQTFSGLACASCHPEAREDGVVWDFVEFGARRTQLVAGGILDRAPYHWGGDMNDFDTLLDEVFVRRMGGIGPLLGSRDLEAVGPWLGTLPAPRGLHAADAEAVTRGERVFDTAGCTTCHNGDLLTNNRMEDVGTGQAFKVPTLRGVWARAPFMHTGCAPTLRDRFTASCGGGDSHGLTSSLSANDVDDLVRYLETL